MTPILYAHPFSSYSQKVLIALYEHAIEFDYRILSPENPAAMEELSALWPLKRFPVLVSGGRTLLEASIIVEFLDLHHARRFKLIPADPDAALAVRTMDRIFDNYVMTPMQEIVLDHLRPDGKRDPFGVAQARSQLDQAYRWLDQVMARQPWAAGEHFSLADCAAAPSLFYADWVQPIGPEHGHARAYRSRLLGRASVARAVDEARPYRHFFPPGAPDRD